MATSNMYRHLTIEDRRIIEQGIREGLTKVSIAAMLGKDRTTIGKEISKHRTPFYFSKLDAQCKHYKKCPHKRMLCGKCSDFELFVCPRRDHSPGACNGCSNMQKCRFDKFKYEAGLAQTSYKKTLTESREGLNISEEEIKKIGEIIAKPLKQGQSPYHVLIAHPEIRLSLQTLYRYIEEGLFRPFGIDCFVLRQKLSRRVRKNRKNTLKKRVERKYLRGREMNDLKVYLENNPEAKIVEMDTVYNDISTGPFIQTFKFKNEADFFFAIYHENLSAEGMAKGVDLLEEVLTPALFREHIDVILTDRGSEFSAPDKMEDSGDGSKRCRVFFCDPMRSDQKGSLENKHKELRYILPKARNLRNLGLNSQDDLNLVLSHLNSAPTKKLNGKSPLELLAFLHPTIHERLSAFGIKNICKDEIVLNPLLLKK